MGMPFALTLFRPELDIWSPGEHNGTFRGFQLATVAGKAGLEFMLQNNLEAEVRRKSAIVDQYLAEHLPAISDKLSYRGIGRSGASTSAPIPRAPRRRSAPSATSAAWSSSWQAARTVSSNPCPR